MTTATPPISRRPVAQRTVRFITWGIQAAIALGLAMAASLAGGGLGIMLTAAAVGVLIASGVGLGVQLSEHEAQTKGDE